VEEEEPEAEEEAGGTEASGVFWKQLFGFLADMSKNFLDPANAFPRFLIITNFILLVVGAITALKVASPKEAGVDITTDSVKIFISASVVSWVFLFLGFMVCSIMVKPTFRRPDKGGERDRKELEK